jgi:hypothetical protein
MIWPISQGGVVQALSVHNRWRGYLMDYGEPSKPVFTLQDPKPVLSCAAGDVRVTVEPKGRKRHWDYEVTGSFPHRACAVKSRTGHVVAQVKLYQLISQRSRVTSSVQFNYKL